MATYTTLDYLLDLTPYERSSARTLTFSVADSNSAGWDYSAVVAGLDDYALLHDNYKFYAREGATYDITSASYYDPFILKVYDSNGNTIAANEEYDDLGDIHLSDGGYYSSDTIFDWVAPYTGVYYVSASWNQGYYYKFYWLSVNENRDTISTVVNQPPAGSLAIRGVAMQGQILTAESTLTDANGLGVINYQWKANGLSISGANTSTYTLTQAEVGKTITVTASYTDGQGAAESKTSAATAAVANVNDLPSGTVTISGTATQGQTLTAANSLADADGLGTISYQWKANGTAISGATRLTYTLTQAEVGKAITVTASYTDQQGTAETKTSAATKAVLNGLTAGTTGNDTLMGTYGADKMTGQTGNDIYYVNHASDVIAEAASGGTETVYSYLSSYTLGANLENGRLMSSTAATLIGNGLANTLIGNAGNDVLNGVGGNDVLRGGTGKDALDGGAGTDTADYSDKSVAVIATLNGAVAVSVKVSGLVEDSIKNIENLSGGSASDILTGDTLANTLTGNAGNDTLKGMGGNDNLRGGLGNDILTGGTGQDIFRFDTALNRTSNVDRITDFSAIDDAIQLENSIFTKLGSTTTGTLNINYFKVISTGGATDSNDYIVYNKTTGALYYDADGGADGNSDGIQFAAVTLVGTAPLTNADFVLI